MHKQPLLIMLLCFMAGIVAADRIGVHTSMPYWAAGVGLGLAGLGFLKNYWLQTFRPAFLGLFFFGVGALALYQRAVRPNIQSFKGKQTFVFSLDKKLNSSEKFRRYEVKILKVKNAPMAAAPQAPRPERPLPPFKAVISISKDLPQLDYRHIFQTDAYINPVEAPDNDFQFNYAKYLSRKQIYHQIFINSQPLKAEKNTLTFSDRIRQHRLEVLMRIDQSGLSPKTREFLKGIILADRTEMDAGTVADFSRSGLVHLLAISGSHMVMIFGIILFLFKNLFPSRFRKAAIVIALLAIWSFAMFIDYGSSVVRSCIMMTAYYLYVLLQRRTDLLHAMALAAFCILIVDPHQLFDVGFQLSFVAVLGIYWLNQPVLAFFGNLTNRPKRFLANVFSVSLSAQLATLPLVIYYFHQYSALSVVANLVVIPFSEIIIIFSVLMCALLAFNIEFQGLNFVFEGFVECLLRIIHWFAEKDFAFAEHIGMAALEASLLLCAVYLLRDVLQKKNVQPTILLVGVILLFTVFRLGLNFYYFKNEEVMLTQNFNHKILIVKTGSLATFYVKETSDQKKIEKYVVAPYIASRRIHDFKIQKIPEGTNTIAVDGKAYHME